MGGAVTKTSYTLDELIRIAGSKWTDELYLKFMSKAVLKEVTDDDGKVTKEYRVFADFVRKEIDLIEAAEENAVWRARRDATAAEEAIKGSRICIFTPEEIQSCTDTSCRCANAESIINDQVNSHCSVYINSFLSSIQRFVDIKWDGMDPSVVLYAEDPVPGVNRILQRHGELFLDREFPVGSALAGPCSGVHTSLIGGQNVHSSMSYNFDTLKCFARLSQLNPRPTCIFDSSGDRNVMSTLVQMDVRSGNSEMLSALSAIAGLYEGEFIKSLISPNEINVYGIYSVKIHLQLHKDGSDTNPQMVDGYILIDDFIPADETNCCIFSAAPAHGIPCAWSMLLEKAAAKLFGQSRGGYREIAHAPVYAGKMMYLLTGVPCIEMDITQSSQWRRLHKLYSSGHDCRVGAATVTKPGLNKNKVHGIATGAGVHGYTIKKTFEVPTKFKDPIRLLRLRNTCEWSTIIIIIYSNSTAIIIVFSSLLSLLGGKYHWDGPWSETSKEFKAHQKLLIAESSEDDGSFWIAIEDFVQYFQGLYAIIIPLDWHKHTQETLLLHNEAEKKNTHVFLKEPESNNELLFGNDASPPDEGGTDPFVQKLLSPKSPKGSKEPSKIHMLSERTATFNRGESIDLPLDKNPFTSVKLTPKVPGGRLSFHKESFEINPQFAVAAVANMDHIRPPDMSQIREAIKQSFDASNSNGPKNGSTKFGAPVNSRESILQVILKNGDVDAALADSSVKYSSASKTLPRNRRNSFYS